MGKNSLTVSKGASAGELYRELERRFQLQTVAAQFKEQSLQITKVADLDQLLEGVSDADQIPFWAELWPAALGLTRFIADNAHLVARRSVLELGAGVGLAGIAARLAGADLLQTDYLEEALRFIRVNSLRNGLSEPRLLLADWRAFPEIGRFDLVLGADILYERTLHDDLMAVIEKTVKPDGLVWLADPGREAAVEFILKMTERGWSLSQTQTPVNHENKLLSIDIYQLRPGRNRE